MDNLLDEDKWNNKSYKEDDANDFYENILNKLNKLNNTPISNHHRVKNTYKIKNIIC